MSIPYEVAMSNLQAMFHSLDREEIHHTLVKNKGRIDPTIEDLLSLADNRHSEDENLFQEIEIKTTKFSGSNPYSRKSNVMKVSDDIESYDFKAQELQEQKELALKLQEAYIKEQEMDFDETENEYDDYEDDSYEENYYSKNDISKKKESNKDKGRGDKNIASKIAEKFSNLFGRKKADKTQQKADQKGQFSVHNPSKDEKKNNIKEYTFSKIEKMSDCEIISFDNKIEGGGLQLCTDAQRNSTVDFDLSIETETIPLTKQNTKLKDDSYYRISEYNQTNDEQTNKYFKIDDNEEEEIENQIDYTIKAANNISGERDLNSSRGRFQSGKVAA